METLNAIEVDHEYKTWLNKLSFCRDELKIMKHRLAEIAAKNTHRDVLAMVEHFQNQLIVQSNNIDELRHEIKQFENRLEARVKENFTKANHHEDPDYRTTLESVESFDKVFNELRKETIRFFAEAI